jgi:hypothetical protein
VWTPPRIFDVGPLPKREGCCERRGEWVKGVEREFHAGRWREEVNGHPPGGEDASFEAEQSRCLARGSLWASLALARKDHTVMEARQARRRTRPVMRGVQGRTGPLRVEPGPG